MKKIIRLDESDLKKIVHRIIQEQKVKTGPLQSGEVRSCSTFEKAQTSCYSGLKVRFDDSEFSKYMIPTIYKVKAGDTLSELSKRFKVNVKDLMRVNKYFKDTDLKADHIILFDGFKPGD